MEEFQELYLKYNERIYNFLLKFTGYDSELAEELTQETFFQVFLSLSKYKGESSVYTWICSIAKNVCCKYYRKNPVCVALSTLESDEREHIHNSVNMYEIIEKKELSSGIIKEIMSLKKKYKDVVVYRLFFEFSFHEIAEILGIKENSVKVIYHRGKEQVRKKLEVLYGGIY